MIETYASYVWACYGATVAVWAVNFWLARKSYAKELQSAHRRAQIAKESAP
jgi:heme exporter protein D